jgi:hypothetical protein
MRQSKLIAGKMNIRYIKVKSGAAHGAKKPQKLKNRPETQVIQFNGPQLVICLRKAA